MNILFLCVSLPHLDNRSSLFTSLIHEFKDHGHNIFVSTKRTDGGKKSQVIEENGIKTLRIAGPAFTGVSSTIKKGLAYQEYVIKQRYLTLKYFGKEKIDLIISHSLPPELAWVIAALKRKYKCPFLLLQTDFTWQDAVAYGYFSKNGPIGLYYRFWEKKLFKLADFVGCLSQGYIDFITKSYPIEDISKYFVVNLWGKKIEIEKNDIIRKKLGLEGKFVGIYGGTVGPAQKLEHILDLAETTKGYKDIVFLILGKGAYVSKLKNNSESRNLHNVIFLDFLPQQEYLSLLASCDAGFIVLNEKHATPNIPSKTLSYFSLGIPILAAIDHVTDYGQLLDVTCTGLWCYSGDVLAFKENLLTLYNNPDLRRKMSLNGMSYFEEYMQPINAYVQIMNVLNAKES